MDGLETAFDRLGMNADSYVRMPLGRNSKSIGLMFMMANGIDVQDLIKKNWKDSRLGVEFGFVSPQDAMAKLGTMDTRFLLGAMRRVRKVYLDDEYQGEHGTMEFAEEPVARIAEMNLDRMSTSELREVLSRHASLPRELVQSRYEVISELRKLAGAERQEPSVEPGANKRSSEEDRFPVKRPDVRFKPSGLTGEPAHSSEAEKIECARDLARDDSSVSVSEPKQEPIPDDDGGSPGPAEAGLCVEHECFLATDCDDGSFEITVDVSTDFTYEEIANIATNVKRFVKKKGRATATKAEVERFKKEFDKAKAAELATIDRMGVWKHEKKPTAEMFAKAMPAVWVLTFKVRPENATELTPMMVKARLVAQGFKDARIDEDGKLVNSKGEHIRTDSPTVAAVGTRLVVAKVAQMGWDLWSLDVKGAFLQADEYPESERIFLLLPDGRVMRLYKSLYGTGDAPRRWFQKISKVLLELGMRQSVADEALFLWPGDVPKTWQPRLFESALNMSYSEMVANLVKMPEVRGVIALHVDDGLGGGDAEFERKVVANLTQRFEIGKLEKLKVGMSLMHTGMRITRLEKHLYKMDQKEYIVTMHMISVPERATEQERKRLLDTQEYKEYRTCLGECLWVTTHTRPDQSVRVSFCASSANSPTVGDALELNKVVKALRMFGDACLTYRKLEGLLREAVHADASFGQSSQGGYVSLLCEFKIRKGGRTMGVIIAWGSHRIKRVCKSTLGCELLTTSAALDIGDLISVLLAEMWLVPLENGNLQPVHLITDAKSVESTTSTSRQPKEKNLVVDMFRLRQRKKDNTVKIGWVGTKGMLGDALTKFVRKPYELLCAMMKNSFILSGKTEGVRTGESVLGESLEE